MALERKSEEEARSIGKSLKGLRLNIPLTLQQVANQTSVDVGQLSRFERGDFKKLSPNLQKYLQFLQHRSAGSAPALSIDDLTAAVVRLAERSARHRAAAHAVLRALETLN
jgi:transcriptional regulator with XRE-family HTH domain